jgi:hypothetical protein
VAPRVKNNGTSDAVLVSDYNAEHGDPTLAPGQEREGFFPTSGYTDDAFWGDYYSLVSPQRP